MMKQYSPHGIVKPLGGLIVKRVLWILVVIIILVPAVGCRTQNAIIHINGQNQATTTIVHRFAKQLPESIEWDGSTFERFNNAFNATGVKFKKVGKYKGFDLYEMFDPYDSSELDHSVKFVQDAFGDFIPYRNPKEPILLKKPNIYLYPENQETLRVDVKLHGKITASTPAYKNGWVVEASPAGTINGRYGFIYYEALLDYPYLLDKGWIVDKAHFNEQMERILLRIGLNKKERDDFVGYWNGELSWQKSKYAAYYIPPQEVNKAVELKLSKQPDSLLRFYFVFSPVDNNIQIKEPDLQPFVRKGFTVVEWGGIGK